MVDANTLRRRLDALQTYLQALEQFRGVDREVFLADPSIHHLAERYLHLSVECVIDIAHHLISDARLETPTTYRDSFAVLARHGVLESGLAGRLQGWAGFRNVLVHAYLDVDHGVAWDTIQRDLGDLRAFAAAAAARMD